MDTFVFAPACLFCGDSTLLNADWCGEHVGRVKAHKHAVLLQEARELFTLHGLNEWKVQLDLAKSWLGRTYHKHRVIQLSRAWAAVRPLDASRHTFLHELAHALVGPGHGHDEVWAKQALELGIDTTVHGLVDSSLLELPWVGTCAAGHSVARALPPEKLQSCSQCSPEKFSIPAMLTWVVRGREATLDKFPVSYREQATALSDYVRAS